MLFEMNIETCPPHDDVKARIGVFICFFGVVSVVWSSLFCAPFSVRLLTLTTCIQCG
mgnify:CR=1 FL=1